MALLTLENIAFRYEQQQILTAIHTTIHRGEFITIFGPTGSGKSTLLKLLKPELQLDGHMSGSIFYNGEPLTEKNSVTIGYMLQNPNEQFIMETVWQELAFGLENLALPQADIQQRIAEVVHFFGLQSLFYARMHTLSGGQKQLVNLAAILAMRPDVLLLDEPTSQLDPIAATEFIQLLRKVNEELGITVIVVEHRLEELMTISDRMLYIEHGKLLYDAPPNEIGSYLRQHPMLQALSAATQLYCQLEDGTQTPVTIRDGMRYVAQYEPRAVAERLPTPYRPFLVADMIYFRYTRNSEDIVQQLNVTIGEGEIFSIVGGNGVGKSTLLELLSGHRPVYKGRISINGIPIRNSDVVSALLPQNPQALFTKMTIREELLHAAAEPEVMQLCERLQLIHLLDRHPLDVSGGEQQQIALVKLLLLKPDLLLLDEPTKGVDSVAKAAMIQLLQELSGHMTIVIVTHDLEFAAAVSNRCSMLFHKQLVAIQTPQQFFTSNQFYTTAASRIARHTFPGAVTLSHIIAQCTLGGKKHAQ